MAECRSCNARIYWRRHARSRQAAPIDAAPVPGGNIAILDAEVYDVVTDKDEIARRVDLHMNHFATCKAPPKRKGKK